ncbi:ABC transporter permease [Ekhidna sp.]
MKRITHLFKTAFNDARKNLLHTLLSVLGMVIGVGALVAILSLIDGMEKYAHEQISSTTSLESVIIRTNTTKRIDNVQISKEDYGFFNYARFKNMLDEVSDENAKGFLRYQESGFINTNDSTERGVLFSGMVDTWSDKLELRAGRFISLEDLRNRTKNVVVSSELAEALKPQKPLHEILNDTIRFKGEPFNVIGIIDAPSDNLEIICPITILDEEKLKSRPPMVVIEASTVEQVPIVKGEVESFLENTFKGQSDDFSVFTNEFRVEQANQGFLVFRIIMGLIVGISVIVGGVGVMNVLLISVTERTSEIGVRKAVGAKKADIVAQFLSESLSISFIGSFLGLILGVIFTFIAVPIVKYLTKMPFEAAYTLDTLLIIMIVSILIGIIFGTYPAMKASKLDPVDAIRRE